MASRPTAHDEVHPDSTMNTSNTLASSTSDRPVSPNVPAIRLSKATPKRPALDAIDEPHNSAGGASKSIKLSQDSSPSSNLLAMPNAHPANIIDLTETDDEDHMSAVSAFAATEQGTATGVLPQHSAITNNSDILADVPNEFSQPISEILKLQATHNYAKSDWDNASEPRFRDLSDEEFLGGHVHPNDICGSKLVEVIEGGVSQVFAQKKANALYKALGGQYKKGISHNTMGQRYRNALSAISKLKRQSVEEYKEDLKANRARVSLAKKSSKTNTRTATPNIAAPRRAIAAQPMGGLAAPPMSGPAAPLCQQQAITSLPQQGYPVPYGHRPFPTTQIATPNHAGFGAPSLPPQQGYPITSGHRPSPILVS